MEQSKQIMPYDRHSWQIIAHNKEEKKLVIWNPVERRAAAVMEEYNSFTVVPSHPTHSPPSSPPTSSQYQESRCPMCHQRWTPPLSKQHGDTDGEAAEEVEDTIDIDSTPLNYKASNYFQLLGYQLQHEQTASYGHRRDEWRDNPLSPESLNSNYYKRFFREEKKIGSGGFGSVFLCKHVINEIELGYFAVKKVPVGDNRPWLQKVLREVQALVTLKKHPNIINYSHSWLEYDQCADFGPKVPCLFILMEYANSGNLHQLIWGKRRTRLSESDIWNYFIDLCKGLDYLHKHGIIHRDIKPQNILVNNVVSDLTGTSHTRLLISDFGTCMEIWNKKDVKRTGNTGTLEYLAPELLVHDSNNYYSMDFDYKCDIWSLGIMLYAMAFSTLPFRHADGVMISEKDELVDEIQHFSEVPFPATHNRSESLLLLIRKLLQRDPTLRPSTTEILSSPFITNLIFEREKSEFNTTTTTTTTTSTSAYQQIVPAPLYAGRAKEVLPLRKRNKSAPVPLIGALPSSTPVTAPMKTPSFEYYPTLLQFTSVFVLLAQLYLCMNSCSSPAAINGYYLYSVMFLSVLMVLPVAHKYVTKMLLCIVQWSWIMFCHTQNWICDNGETSVNVTFYSSLLSIFCISLAYLSSKLKINNTP